MIISKATEAPTVERRIQSPLSSIRFLGVLIWPVSDADVGFDVDVVAEIVADSVVEVADDVV